MTEYTSQPTQIVILGGGGDLAKRKLIPALLDLYVSNRLPDVFTIIGMARTPRTAQEYQSFVADSLLRHEHNHTKKEIKAFCKHIQYVTGSFDDTASWDTLNDSLGAFDTKIHRHANRMFYLAVPPTFYKTIFTHLHEKKLAQSNMSASQWSRILVEKPFGKDLKTAQDLEATLTSLFSEDQIFRIDHYLAKEAVQNILSFRFANRLLQSPWNGNDIQEVQIIMHEDIDVEHRGNFYDSIGTLRDVGQNHLLQLLALIAMDEPADFKADTIRKERTNVLQQLIAYTPQTITDSVVRGQYEGYTQTAGVAQDSETETFFALTAFLDSDTWRNVPFHIRAGKAMGERRVAIEILFKDVTSGPFTDKHCNTTGNKVVLTISPQQTLEITLNAKQAGHGYQLEPRTLLFTCGTEKTEMNAYEKVLLDCIVGDQTLFTQTQEVLASWKFITSVHENWQHLPLHIYKKKSNGPVQ